MISDISSRVWWEIGRGRGDAGSSSQWHDYYRDKIFHPTQCWVRGWSPISRHKFGLTPHDPSQKMIAARHFIEDQVGKCFTWVDAFWTKPELVSIYISKYLLIRVSRCPMKQVIQLLRPQWLNICSFFFLFYSYNEYITTNTSNLLDKIHYEK